MQSTNFNPVPLVTLLITFFVSAVFGQTSVDDVQEQAAELGRQITAQTGIFGAILIVGGLLFVFFGYKMFRIMCFVAGFYTGIILSYIILVNVEPDGGYQNRETVYLVTGIAVGVLLGLLFAYFVRLGLAAIGGLGGFFLSIYILSWTSSGLIQSEVGRSLFIAAFVIVGVILTYFFERPIIYFGTAFSGAFSVIYGIDVFARKGFTESVQISLTNSGNLDPALYEMNGVIYGYLASILLLGILGIVVQYKMNRDYTTVKP